MAVVRVNHKIDSSKSVHIFQTLADSEGAQVAALF